MRLSPPTRAAAFVRGGTAASVISFTGMTKRASRARRRWRPLRGPCGARSRQHFHVRLVLGHFKGGL